MAERPKELPDLPQRLDQAILDPLLADEQLLEMCDAGRQEAVRAICTTLPQLTLLRPHTPVLRQRCRLRGQSLRLALVLVAPGQLRANVARRQRPAYQARVH